MPNSSLSGVREHLKNGDAFVFLDKDNTKTDDIIQAVSMSFVPEGSADSNIIIPMDQETEFEIENKPVILRVILHCWMHKDSSAADYLADCQKKHLTNISFLQRSDLINWLIGQSETSQYVKSTIKDTTEGNNVQAKLAQEKSTKDSKTSSSELDNIQKEDPVLFEALQHERVLMDHDSNLRGSKPINFGYLIKDAELKLAQSIKSSLRSKSGKNTAGHVSKTSAVSKTVLRKDPIILIPSATSSILTLSNIKDFLEHSKYTNPREVEITNENNLVTIEKKFERLSRPIRFLIVNNTRMFTKPEYWDRVVAVFTTGHAWQFNNYQWNTPQELFKHCRGYYFHFNADEVPQNVQQWNVERIALDKHQRFKDVEVVRYFWTNLEKELLAKGYH